MKFPTMRQASIYLVLAGAAALGGCSSKVDFRNADIVNGKIYKQGADSEFSGSVTNVPEHVILDRREGYWPFRDALRNIMAGTRYRDLLYVTASVCDVNVDDGLLDGDVVCRRPQSETLKYEMHFKNGALDGAFKVYDLSDKNNVVAAADFDNGVLDGKQEILGLQSHKVIYRVQRKDGLAEGKEERFDETTGELIGRWNYSKGKLEGESIRYAPDGKRVLYRVNASEGLKDGLEEEFHPETGKPLKHVEWAKGKRHGKVKEWDPEGNLKVDAIYENDLDVTPRPAVVPAPASTPVSAAGYATCMELWTAAFRKEYGEGEAIPRDQLTEWQLWCDADKRPS